MHIEANAHQMYDWNQFQTVLCIRYASVERPKIEWQIRVQ